MNTPGHTVCRRQRRQYFLVDYSNTDTEQHTRRGRMGTRRARGEVRLYIPSTAIVAAGAKERMRVCRSGSTKQRPAQDERGAQSWQ